MTLGILTIQKDGLDCREHLAHGNVPHSTILYARPLSIARLEVDQRFYRRLPDDIFDTATQRVKRKRKMPDAVAEPCWRERRRDLHARDVHVCNDSRILDAIQSTDHKAWSWVFDPTDERPDLPDFEFVYLAN